MNHYRKRIQKKLSNGENAELVRLYLEGARTSELIAKYGCSRSHIYRMVKLGGNVVRDRRGSQDDRRSVPPCDDAAVVWRYAEARESAKDIAASYGCTHTSIYKVLDRHGIARHSQFMSDAARFPRKRYRRENAPEKRGARKILSPHAERRLETMGVKYVLPQGKPATPSLDAMRESVKALNGLPIVDREHQERYRKNLKDLEEYQAKQAEAARVPSKRTEELYGLPAVDVVKRVIPTVPEPSKIQASTRNGQERAPLRLRFPPLPGEPGYVYREDAA